MLRPGRTVAEGPGGGTGRRFARRGRRGPTVGSVITRADESPVPTTSSLPRVSPRSAGVRSDGIQRFLDVLESDPTIDPHSVMLVRGGAVVAEGWWAPYTRDRLHMLYSLSKTFTSTAVGFALQEGLFDLDDRIIDHFPEFADEITGPRSRAMRVRDALAMATGHHVDMIETAVRTDPAEPVRGLLLHEPESDPGTWFTYNQLGTYSVAAILQRRAGCSLTEYLRPRLFDPLGIGPVGWQQYPAGRNIGFSGLHATTEAIAKLGLLHLRDGVWEGRQLLPAGWAEQVRTPRVDSSREPNPDWAQGYGYQVWMARHGYRGDGAYGQFCVILPEQDVVLAATMATPNMQRVLDAAWAHLLPALADGPLPDATAAAADEALAERLGGLALAASAGEPVTADWAGEYTGDGLTVTVETATGAASTAGLTATVDDGTVRFAVPIGTGAHWTVVDSATDAQGGPPPVAVSGGLVGVGNGDTVAGQRVEADPTLRIDVLFLESPHRLVVDIERTGGRGGVTATWGTEPLRLTDTAFLDQGAPRPLT